MLIMCHKEIVELMAESSATDPAKAAFNLAKFFDLGTKCSSSSNKINININMNI